MAVVFLLLISLLYGCRQAGAPPTETVVATATPPPTEKPKATVTALPSVAPAPTATAVPSPTLVPRPIPIPSLSPSPTATPARTPLPIAWARPAQPVTLTIDAAAGRATYPSGEARVSGFFYRPQGGGPFPAMLVLHGRAGQGDAQRAYASWLATQGYVALAPDYFNPIAMTREKFDASYYEKAVDPAREVLGRGLESLSALPYVYPKRLGVVGFSLGGYMAFVLGTRDDVRGVVSYYGAYAPRLVARYSLGSIVAQIKAPVLMFHGDADQDVPVANAQTARDLLASSGRQFEYVAYPGVGHAFNAPGAPTFDARATADAQQRTLAFLKEKLK